MEIFKIWRHGVSGEAYREKAINYALNERKVLWECYGVQTAYPHAIFEQMKIVSDLWGNNGKNPVFHFVISFEKKTVNDPFTAMAYVKQIFEHLLSDHQIVISIHKEDDGNVSLRDNIGYASTRISNEQRCFLYACGGENITAWNLIPKLHSLLNKEEIYDYLTEISAKTGKAIEEITVQKVQDYIQKTYPELIEQWLDEYFYNDPSGYLEDRVQRIYESIISKLDSYEE